MANTIKILHCSCDLGDGAKYQDKKYGNQKRVHNGCKDDKFRCTVCGNVKTASNEPAPAFKKR